MDDQTKVKPEKIYSVSDLTRMIKLELESTFPLVWLEGEISNYHRHHSGHIYLSLKDEESQIRAVIWRSFAQKIPFQLENGLQIVCSGSINVYEPRGEYQITIERVEPKGKGSLQLAFEQLKEKLNKEGLFDPAKKKKLPLVPKKIGVVTSPRGAAIADIISILERRFARIHVVVFPAKVQGKGAAEEIVEGIEYLNEIQNMDVIIIGRGGGSIEDLWAFNEEIVARAIFRSRIPIISAVGHEVDFTISDFVADIRASTPSAAAEIVVEKEHALLDRIDNLEKRVQHRMEFKLQEFKQNVSGLIHHNGFQNFKIRVLNLTQHVDDLEMRSWTVMNSKQQKLSGIKASANLIKEKLSRIIQERIQINKGKWEMLSTELHNLSPLNILKKGYALCWKDEGSYLVRGIDEISLNDNIVVSFHKGEFECSVIGIDKNKKIESRTNNERS